MAYSVLVGTQNAAFGELIRISLEENAEYRVRLVHHAGQVLATMERIPVDLAILDADLPGQAFIELVKGLQQRFSRVKLMVIPPDNNPAHPALQGLNPHSYLNKPFYLPDLLETVDRLLQGQAQPPPALYTASENLTEQSIPLSKPIAAKKPSAWVDSHAVEQRIAELLPGSPILESLILQNGKTWVYAGKLSEKDVRELEGVFNRLMREGSGLLIRFIRLVSGRDYLLYAAGLVGDLHLILVFPGNYPLSRMRTQATSFRTSLKNIFPGDEEALPALVGHGEIPGEVPEVDDVTLAAIDQAFTDEEGQSETEVEAINLSEILGEIPNPDPGAAGLPEVETSEWNLDPGSQTDKMKLSPSGKPPAKMTLDKISWDKIVLEELSRQQPEVTTSSLEDTQPNRSRQDPGLKKEIPPFPTAQAGDFVHPKRPMPPFTSEPGQPPQQRQSLPSQPPQPKNKEEPGSENPPFDWMDTEDAWTETYSGQAPPVLEKAAMPFIEEGGKRATETVAFSRVSTITELETAYPAYSSLTYTFVMIPLLPTARLESDLAAQLAKWVPQLCLAYGWRLDQAQVLPQYIQWSVRVLPFGSPGNIANIMRLQLSNQILRHHPDLEDLLPSGDFWASAYLVLSGAHGASPQLIKDFISDVRLRQGIKDSVAQDVTIRDQTADIILEEDDVPDQNL